jgi:hypothetical protein
VFREAEDRRWIVTEHHVWTEASNALDEHPPERVIVHNVPIANAEHLNRDPRNRAGRFELFSPQCSGECAPGFFW